MHRSSLSVVAMTDIFELFQIFGGRGSTVNRGSAPVGSVPTQSQQ